VVAESADGESAVHAITRYKPDLVMLDVQMPGVDGFGVLEAVASTHLPAIIFVTAHDQYAVKAFDTQAVDYLLKPFKQDRFVEALARAKIRLEKDGNNDEQEKLLALLRRVSGDRGRMVIRTEGKIVFLRSQEVEWIEAAGNYIRLHAGQRTYTVREKIGDFEGSLAPEKFIRIHRSVIVNLDVISEIHSCGGGEFIVVLRSGKELPLGRTYRDSLDALIERQG
jgi:two-component system, LytTR family, response regulator